MKKSPLNLALKLLCVVVVLGLLLWFVPWLGVIYLVCGLYDVLRNSKRDLSVIAQYFTGNGILTWLLSPFNVLMDILTLPFINKGIYRLEDLPEGHQAEVRRLIGASTEANLVKQLEEHTKGQPRTMFFFKWYGANRDTPVSVPAFHENWQYIKTIGVSVFNQRESTSRHFGPMRATLRVLYNINRMEDYTAYIEVGNVKHYWKDEPLFIFDDTLLHQSFNESDKARYCLFVDIVRPSLVTALLSSIVSGLRFFLSGVNAIFYKNWKVVEK